MRNRRHLPPVVSVLLWDIGLALGVYYGARALGANEYVSLLAGTITAGLRVAYVGVRERAFDVFSGVMGAVLAVGLVLSFFSGEARVLLLLKSTTMLVVAAMLVGTCVVGRPATLSMAKRFGAQDDQTRRRWDALYTEVPAYRRLHLMMTLVCAGAMLLEAAARIPVIYLLPLDTAVGISSIMVPVTFGLLWAWTAWHGNRHGERIEREYGALTARSWSQRPV